MDKNAKLTSYERIRRIGYRKGEPRKTFVAVPTAANKPKSTIVIINQNK